MAEKSLKRFHDAQERDYKQALAEIRNGHKRSHWIWYIFPQIAGMGYSSTSKFYAITDFEEAAAYWEDPVLRARLLEISGALLNLASNDAGDVMGWPDDMKLQSCMTLFGAVAPEEETFRKVLEKFFRGEPDGKTLRILREDEGYQKKKLQ